MPDKIRVKGPDEDGMVRVCVPPMGRDCSWVICFRKNGTGQLHYTNLAYTYGLGDKTEDTEKLNPRKETIALALSKAQEHVDSHQPRLL